MKLTNDQILSVTVGALHSETTPDGIRFDKCTKRQLQAWYDMGEVYGKNAEASTGVRLDFWTDSKSIAFDLASGNNVDVYFDGVLRHFLQFDELHKEGKDARLVIDKPLGEVGGTTRVTVYFSSHHVPTVLRYVELDDGATLTRPTYACKLLFCGDSITQGWNSHWDSLSFANSISRFFDAESVVQGVGGAVFKEDTFDPDLPFDPDAVVIAYGTNDYYYYKSYDEIRTHCAAYLTKMKEFYADHGKPVFVLMPLWRGDRFYNGAVGDFATVRQIQAEEAKKLGLISIDTINFIPPLPEFFSDKVLHPNAVGFGIYTQNIIKEMVKYL